MAVNASPRGGYEFPIPRWIFEVLAIVFSAGPPMAFYIAYRAEGAWFPLIATALMVPILAMLADAAQKRIVRWSLHLLQAALLLGQVLLIVILVSITSASTYGAWFFYVSRQAASSTISYYFAIKFLFFSSLTSLALRRGNITRQSVGPCICVPDGVYRDVPGLEAGRRGPDSAGVRGIEP
jgi:hypothetical protein